MHFLIEYRGPQIEGIQFGVKDRTKLYEKYCLRGTELKNVLDAKKSAKIRLCRNWGDWRVSTDKCTTMIRLVNVPFAYGLPDRKKCKKQNSYLFCDLFHLY